MNKASTMRTLAAGTFFFAAMVLFGACGSKQKVEARQEGPPPSFDCISDRWAEPPAQIGQTPPDISPSASDVDPFLDAPQKD